jgi:hypothetical protein
LLYWRVYERASRETIHYGSAVLRMGHRRANLVPVSIPAAGGVLRHEIFSQAMTAWHTLGICVAFIISVPLLAGAGAVLLRFFKVAEPSSLDHFLFSITAGTVLLELAVSAGELAPQVGTGVRIATAIVAFIGLFGIRAALADLRRLTQKFFALHGVPRHLAAGLLFVLSLQGVASLAPLTGSDALHYHFTVQQIYLAEGFHAPWSLLHGFFCGLGHQLILAGLALGSGRLAQLWLFLGGAVGVLATLRIARLWIGGAWPWLAALAFALTPVTFWQMTAAGAPDIWMCALVPVGVLAILKARANPGPGAILLAGFFAGATAGTKYTGVFLAAALLAGFLAAIRSAAKGALFFAAAVATGIWIYLRNWLWTGDPVFPFVFARMHHSERLTNGTAINSILLDTGAAHSFSLWELIKFPFFAAVDQSHLGAWQLLGPLVLAFAPLAIPQLRKSMEGRVALVVWVVGALGIGVTSAMARFLLPLLPIALAASFAGVALATHERWRILRSVSLLSIAAFLVAGFAAMTFYSRQAWSAAIGRTSQEDYLVANSPDYERSQFVNREVERSEQPGRALIFFRHLYYLRVPFFNGDPDDSWELNPALLTSPDAWIRLFAKHQIRWVLKAPDYPVELSDSLTRLESAGILAPCASGEVTSFSGNRIEGRRVRESITLMCVQGPPPAR